MSDDSSPAERVARRRRAVIWGGVAIPLLLYVIPYGHVVGRPLVWLSTLVHELGHGITAWLVGGSFDHFVMFTDGSGVAHCNGQHEWGHALTCAGGLVGPALIAAIGFVVARRERASQVGLGVVALALLVLTIAVAGNAFAWVFMLSIVAVLTWIVARRSAEPAQIATVFLSIQLALSVFSRGDYLFMREATTGEGVSPSDVAIMSKMVGGPFWMWGLACGGFSILVLAAGLWLFTRGYLDLRWPRRKAVAAR
ncbi:M50 family metallopeptidase [Enhygromyxa salina]|uniref:Peptidase M50B-like protein n=1 Tax=Enhygromyxa salina TaxID=215803 RepID=A0A2S9XTG0_9BACT|nr:M50 family metallopeptidase [Enhygromyxa salina]PRP96145.1 hypothetical protein ENSA7_69590 [Enhygromyxa salina]